MHNYERTILRRALTQQDWNLSATARSLGLAESSLCYKLKKLGVARREGRPDKWRDELHARYHEQQQGRQEPPGEVRHLVSSCPTALGKAAGFPPYVVAVSPG